jgi:hypothetical protein
VAGVGLADVPGLQSDRVATGLRVEIEPAPVDEGLQQAVGAGARQAQQGHELVEPQGPALGHRVEDGQCPIGGLDRTGRVLGRSHAPHPFTGALGAAEA